MPHPTPARASTAVTTPTWFIDYPAEDISFSLTVWVCDTPDGEYEFLSTLKNEDGTDAGSLFDPAVLVDDGTVYLYGGGSECWILDDDMYTVLEKHQLEGDGIKNFAEGSSIRKVTDEAGPDHVLPGVRLRDQE